MRKERAFRQEFPAIPRRKTGESAEEVVDLFLPNRGAFQAVADERKQLLTVCLLTQDEETSLRKNPACDGVLCVVDKDTPCLNVAELL